jgi:tRNA modification GTPase
MTLDTHDTIVAIASAPGGALRGILRLSGPEVADVLLRSFESGSQLETIKRPRVVSGSLRLPAPSVERLPGDLYFWPTASSYTRQPAAEFHTIGSPPLLQMALRTLCDQGARLARPGEFTLRAFLAGRLDLTQAEAVLGVIDAESSRQLDTALTQLAGGLSSCLNEVRDQLLNLCADLEAGLDFVEDDINFVSQTEMAERLQNAAAVLELLKRQMSTRHVEQALPQAVLVGAPNAGKSSLLNALAGEEAAIVSEISGTTRDYVTRTVDLGGLLCEITDTAGVEHNTQQGPRQSAQSMTQQQQDQARLIIRCLDGALSIPPQMTATAEHELNITTKSDLSTWSKKATTPLIATSATTGEGIDELRAAMRSFFAEDVGSGNEVLATTATRCGNSLQAALTSLRNAERINQSQAGEELLAAELRLALHQIGEIVGAIYTDDILDRIFSRFCIGK